MELLFWDGYERPWRFFSFDTWLRLKVKWTEMILLLDKKLELPTSSPSIQQFFSFSLKQNFKQSSHRVSLRSVLEHFFLIFGYCHHPMAATLNQYNIKMNLVMITGFNWGLPLQPIGCRCIILDLESFAWELIEFRVLSSKNCSFNSWIQPKSVLEYQKCSTPEARTLNSSKVSKPG